MWMLLPLSGFVIVSGIVGDFAGNFDVVFVGLMWT
jgi:hypothetical protein